MADRTARIHEGSTGKYFISPAEGPLVEGGSGFESRNAAIKYLKDDYGEFAPYGDEMYTHYLGPRGSISFLGR